ncbi:MAG: Hcp family type VI secretion system effector [Planctomycetota bacterium]|jgi:type VI protein secretion system component Hcp
MKTKPVKTIVSGGVLTLVALILFSLMVGAGTIPSEPVPAAEGRQFAVMHIENPPIEGPYIHQALPPGGIKVIDLDLGITASPQFSEITITKEFDKASPHLAFYCAAGQHFGTVFIRMLPATISPEMEPPYYEIILVDAVITKVTDGMVYREQYQDYAHMEEVSFKYRQITWSDINSGEMRSWDLLVNQSP